mgnify:CR=1 FL=1
MAFMERMRFAQSYVFKYSPRPGTLAAEQDDDVPEREKDRRSRWRPARRAPSIMMASICAFTERNSSAAQASYTSYRS